jgi:lipopolysaccharide export system permease protein
VERENGENPCQKIMKKLGLTIIDIYIIRKFLGTFVFSILVILALVVIFDFSEKIDDFLENGAPYKAVIFDYYLNFIPYFAVLFSYLFTFISVIFFTSKMAANTEIIALLSSGMSMNRLFRPYFISAVIIAIFSFFMSDLVIPRSNQKRIDFEEKYIHKRPVSFDQRNIHRQIEPGIFIYMERFSNYSKTGSNFSIEKFEDGKLVSKLIADQIIWKPETNNWNIRRYYIRDYNGYEETITEGMEIDSMLRLHPSEFARRPNIVETMSIRELNEFIDDARMKGETNVIAYQIERYKRVATPFATFILTVIGLSVSSRKIRGGIGMHLGIGLSLSFSYILFMQFSSQFSVGGAMAPGLAVWLPNIVFFFIALYLYSKVPK